MTTWTARPTTYRGIRMRSRLEARVAGEMDAAGWEWTYEPQAFANERGQYLPDFMVVAEDVPVPVYVEVKPTLELALLCLERMQIIWDSEPKALLMAFASSESLYGLCAPFDRKWTWRTWDGWTP